MPTKTLRTHFFLSNSLPDCICVLSFRFFCIPSNSHWNLDGLGNNIKSHIAYFSFEKHVQPSADHISQLNPSNSIQNVWWLRDKSFLPGLTHICHRICRRDSQKWQLLMSASAKWTFCRCRDKGFSDNARAGFTTFSREDEQRALCAPQAAVIDIWLGQFSFCAFGPSDNLVALSRDAHKGEPCSI